ncbi:TetR/AcrR family transcriptional regulator [Planctomonas sp. JC2975]|nr:TetR/AcrR family transcriptional regulator [Planctomonas sp. JC2975]NNC13210.1 TetR/AcrR family transcriptional regulator [Planctomonas sp. JC2975]
MPPEERKAAIIQAVIPVMIEHGAALTSRQIAEAAGVAEGTVFRAFGDKDTLLREAAEVYLDPAPVREHLRALDASLPLEDKVRAVLEVLTERFHGVVSIMAALGLASGRPEEIRRRPAQPPLEYASVVARLVEPELDRLNVPPEDIAPFIRLIAFASAIPSLNQEKAFASRELARLIVYGIAGDTRIGEEDAVRKTAARALAGRRAAASARASTAGAGTAAEDLATNDAEGVATHA